MQTITVFDVETAPLPLSEIEPLMPRFEAPSNYKDPEKIKASIEDQKAFWLERSALSATTGRVLCVGFLDDSGVDFKSFPDEEVILLHTWERLRDCILASGTVVGCYIKTFDLPFLMRRSWKLGIIIPKALHLSRYGSDRRSSRNWSDSIVDLAEVWGCGNRDPRDRISLNDLSKFLGVGQKTSEGKDFAALWANDKPKALEYLQNDLTLTKACYERMEGL